MAEIDDIISKGTLFVDTFEQRAQRLRKQLERLSKSTQSNLPAEFIKYITKYDSWLSQMIPSVKNMLGHLVQAKAQGQISQAQCHQINATLDTVNHHLGEIERTQNAVISHTIEQQWRRFIADIVQMARKKLALAHETEQLALKLRDELKRSADVVMRLLNRRPRVSVKRRFSDMVQDRWDKMQVSNRRRKARKNWRISEEKVNKQLLAIRDMHFYMCRDGIRKKIADYWMDKGLQRVAKTDGLQEQRVTGDTVGPQYDKSIKLERVLIVKMRKQLDYAFSKLYYKQPLYNDVADAESTNEHYAIGDLNQFIEMLRLMRSLYQNQIELLSTGRLPYSSRFVNG